MQSRLSNVLALSLMTLLGVGSLTWYYARTFTPHGQAQRGGQPSAASRQEGDSTLPSIGRIDPPPIMPLREDLETLTAPPAEHFPSSASNPTEASLTESPAAYAPTPAPTPEQLAQQRRLSGSVFANATSAQAVAPAPAPASVAPPSALLPSPPAGGAAPTVGDLSALLRPTAAAAVRAEVLPAQRLLLPKGAFIDCTLETAIDSTLPGMTTCVMATDAFGVDGKVVLLERGTKLIGETRGQVQAGQARVFVLWTEARTPAGVVVPLASPGADELGRSGLPGEVNRHFWERFGAAMLISIIDGAAEAAASRNGNGTVVVDPAAAQGVTTEALKGTVNIPPTVTKRNGDRIQVLVARDLDFRSVYELRAVATGR
jgi:type IV secretion system protein VirB10